MTILTSISPIVNALVLADGVYPYNDPEDKFVVIVGGDEVAWAATQAAAWRSYNEIVRVDGEHRQGCPTDFIPWDGSAPADNDWIEANHGKEVDDYAIEAAI